MSLLTSSIDLDTITPPTVHVSQFLDSHIQNLANLFLKAGDTVSPILLHKISPIAFEILEGHFEYYAAMKAQEIDDQFTAIRAYVVPPDLESTIIEQYQFLRSLSAPVTAPATQNLDLAQMEQAIANRLEKTLSTTIDRILEERLNSSLQVLTNQITQQLSAQLLDLKQSLSSAPISQVLEVPTQTMTLAPESSLEQPVKSKPTKASKPKASSSKAKANSIDNNDPKVLEVLNDLNTMNFADLQRNLAKSAKSNTKFAKLINELRLQQPDQKLRSIQDVIANVTGLAEKTMQKIIDAW
jgi:ParB family chromosome partitioning protein